MTATMMANPSDRRALRLRMPLTRDPIRLGEGVHRGRIGVLILCLALVALPMASAASTLAFPLTAALGDPEATPAHGAPVSRSTFDENAFVERFSLVGGPVLAQWVLNTDPDNDTELVVLWGQDPTHLEARLTIHDLASGSLIADFPLGDTQLTEPWARQLVDSDGDGNWELYTLQRFAPQVVRLSAHDLGRAQALYTVELTNGTGEVVGMNLTDATGDGTPEAVVMRTPYGNGTYDVVELATGDVLSSSGLLIGFTGHYAVAQLVGDAQEEIAFLVNEPGVPLLSHLKVEALFNHTPMSDTPVRIEPSLLHVVDLQDDGLEEVLVGGQDQVTNDTDAVRVYDGYGNLSINYTDTIGIELRSLQHDLNGDGIVDLLISRDSGGNPVTYTVINGSTFAASTFATVSFELGSLVAPADQFPGAELYTAVAVANASDPWRQHDATGNISWSLPFASAPRGGSPAAWGSLGAGVAAPLLLLREGATPDSDVLVAINATAGMLEWEHPVSSRVDLLRYLDLSALSTVPTVGLGALSATNGTSTLELVDVYNSTTMWRTTLPDSRITDLRGGHMDLGVGDYLLVVTSPGPSANTTDWHVRFFADNHLPLWTSAPMLQGWQDQLLAVDLRDFAFDPDGDELTFSIDPPLGTINGSFLLWVPTQADIGFHNVTFNTSDGFGWRTVLGGIEVLDLNDPPQVTNVTQNASVVLGASVLLSVEATDPDLGQGDVLVFILDSMTYGEGINISGSQLLNSTWIHIVPSPLMAEINYTPLPEHVGLVLLHGHVQDRAGAMDDFSILLQVVVDDTNHPPVWSPLETVQVFEDELLVVALEVEDPDGDPLELSTDFGHGAINGTYYLWIPTNEDVGFHNITFVADDGRGGIATALLTVQVINVNDAPDLLLPNGTIEAMVGQGLHVPLTVIDPDLPYGDTHTVEAVEFTAGGKTICCKELAQVPWLIVEPSGAYVDYTPQPEHLGDASLILRIADSGGLSDTATLVLHVVAKGNQSEEPKDLPEEKADPIDETPKPPSSPESTPPTRPPAVLPPELARAAAVTVAVIAVGAVAFGTEAGLLGIVAPLYTRLRRDELLDNATRQQVIEFLIRNPGVTYSQLRDELGLQNGTAMYHLRVLEREELIRARRRGGRVLLYIRGSVADREAPPSATAEEMVEAALEQQPGATQALIAEVSGLSQSRVSRALTELLEDGTVVAYRDGRATQYWLSTEDPYGHQEQQPEALTAKD